MLTLIEGGFYSGKEAFIRKEIIDLVKSGDRVTLIVPEQKTVAAESEYSSALPECAPLYFEATNFTRLADTVMRHLGGVSKSHLTAEKRALLMWRVLTELSAVLETVSEKEVSFGSVERALKASADMRALTMGPEDLSRAAELIDRTAAADKRLSAKLRDLSRIMSLYGSIADEELGAATDEISELWKKLCRKEAADLPLGKIYIDGFTSFTEPQYKVIGALMRNFDVKITLGLPRAGADAFEFSELKDTHARLLRIANLESTQVKRERLADTQDLPRAPISEISSIIWRSAQSLSEPIREADDAIEIFSAATPYEECDFIAADIKRQVMAGRRYSDFCIISRSADQYKGIIDVSFKKAGVPLFISRGRSLCEFEAVKLILSAIGAVISGFEREKVMTYAKCSLCGVDSALVDIFELYVNVWQLNRDAFTRDGHWNMNPKGLGRGRDEYDEERLARVNRARYAIIDPLLDLKEELSGKTVSDHCRAIWKFICAIGLEEKIKERAAELCQKGSRDEGELSERSYSMILQALDTLCEVLPTLEVSPRAYLNLLKIAFDSTSFGMIPPRLEEVMLLDAQAARVSAKPFVYIIGATFGAFPKSKAEDGFFSEKDMRRIADCGLFDSTYSDSESAMELYYFERAMATARERLVITYPERSSSMTANSPSEAIGRIRELSGDMIRPRKIASIPMAQRIYSAPFALEAKAEEELYPTVREALIGAGLEEKVQITDADIKNSSLKLDTGTAALMYKSTMALTQSRLDKFSGCPLSYYCSYNLRLDANRRAEFGADNIGTFIHALLERFFLTLKEEGKTVKDIGDEERSAIIRGAADDFLKKCFDGAEVLGPRGEALTDRLCRAAKPVVDGLCIEFSESKFLPQFVELPINRNKDGSAEPAVFKLDDGTEVYIYGIIDRVDTYKSGGDVYVRVVDYKTGEKVFSPKDLEEGKNLQMFLYLKSITETKDPAFLKSLGVEEGGRVIPAGVIYVKADISDPKIDLDDKDAALAAALAKQKRLGMILDDPESIGAQNIEFIPVRFDKKTGQPDRYTKDNLYTLEGWEQIDKIISEAIEKIAKAMRSGDLSVPPRKKRIGPSSPCRFCEYRAICRSAVG